MKILISNDDGVFAPGLAALASTLAEIAEIQVVAPDRNKSGASNSLTLDRPLEPVVHDNGFISINGTPTDCVHLGVSGVLGMKPDLVIAGINAGANLGCDVLYSGTVAAATEGRHLKYPPIAVSLVGHPAENYQTAALIIRDMVEKIDQLNFSPRTVLNINVPDLPLDQVKGVHVTRSGYRRFSDKPVATEDPRGKVRYWISGVGDAADNESGTDFFAVEQGYISVTPLQVDMTHFSGMDNLAGWLETF